LENRIKQDWNRVKEIYHSSSGLKTRYLDSLKQKSSYDSLVSIQEPNRVPGNVAWFVGSKIFVPKHPKTQRLIVDIISPWARKTADMFTNERYTQITELVGTPPTGSYGTTKSKDAGPPPYRRTEDLFNKGLRRRPGEGGGRPGLETMGWAKGMYNMHCLIGFTQFETRQDDTFCVYSSPMKMIQSSCESMKARLGEGLKVQEYVEIGVNALILLEALTDGICGYVCRAGMWVEYNAVVGDRLYTLGRPNKVIPTTPVLIRKME
jgi:hypothetical protein